MPEFAVRDGSDRGQGSGWQESSTGPWGGGPATGTAMAGQSLPGAIGQDASAPGLQGLIDATRAPTGGTWNAGFAGGLSAGSGPGATQQSLDALGKVSSSSPSGDGSGPFDHYL